jgi:hypothetical protein
MEFRGSMEAPTCLALRAETTGSVGHCATKVDYIKAQPMSLLRLTLNNVTFGHYIANLFDRFT